MKAQRLLKEWLRPKLERWKASQNYRASNCYSFLALHLYLTVFVSDTSSNQSRQPWPPEKLRIWTKDQLNDFKRLLSRNACQENVTMLYECIHDNECSNQAITRFNPKDIQLREIPTKCGYGLETICDIIKAQAIIEVTGRVIFDWKVSFYQLN